MSDRLTQKWTPTLAEAFGDNATVRKALHAEHMVYNFLMRSLEVVEVIHNESDKEAQLAGKDIEFLVRGWRDHVSIDVKSNLSGDSFVIDPFKLGLTRERGCHRWWHVNTSTGDSVWYRTDEMEGALLHNRIPHRMFDTQYGYRVRVKVDDAVEWGRGARIQLT